MNIDAKLSQLVAAVEGARAMPMSASCIVNRTEVLELVEDLRGLLPTELREAQWIIKDRDEVIEEGRREAAKLVEEARAERARLVARTEVHAQARRDAEQMLAQAAAETGVMRREVDEYVDTKLATFEVVLHKTLGTVGRGRDKLRGRQELDALREIGPDSELPLPS